MNRKKLRIFIIAPWSMDVYAQKQRTLIGSSEYRLLKALASRGHDVHFIIPTIDKRNRSLMFHGFHIHEFRNPYYYVPILSFVAFLLFSLLHAIQTRKKYGVPHIFYGIHIGTLTAYLLSKIYGKPNISRAFGTTLYPYLAKPIKILFYKSAITEFLIFKTPCKYLIITNDGTHGDEVARRLGVPAHKVKFWRNGVDQIGNFDRISFRKKLGITDDTKIIITLCRLERWKGVHRIIEAMPDIVSNYRKVTLLIIGDGSERKNLENLARKLKVERCVNFMGAVPHEEALKFLGVADIFVSLQDLSNVSESLIEALANGLCIVTSDSGATGEIIKNGENGILLPHNNLRQLPNVVVNLLKEDELRKNLARNAKLSASKHFLSWDKRIEMEVDLIESLV